MPTPRIRRVRPRSRWTVVLVTAGLLLAGSAVAVAYADDLPGSDTDSGPGGYSHRSSVRDDTGPAADPDEADPGPPGDGSDNADGTDNSEGRDSADSADSAGGSRPDGAGPSGTGRAATPRARPGQPDARAGAGPRAAGPSVLPGAAAATGPRVAADPPDATDNLVAGTPCSKQAAACVSLSQQKSWLFKKDIDTGQTVVDHGPVPVALGGPGAETPFGDFKVQWKDKNHKSGEFFVPRGCKPPEPGCEGAPMRWSVFFADGGVAFHEGTLAIRSSGCVRLTPREAEFYYTFLQIGDKVEIRN